jgi:hypothetical protein
MTEGRTDATLFRKLYLVPNAFGYTVPAKRNGSFIACKGDGDFVGTGLKTAIIARRFPRSFKQSIALLLKSKFGDQNVSEHESILSDQEQIGSTNGKPNCERYTRAADQARLARAAVARVITRPGAEWDFASPESKSKTA